MGRAGISLKAKRRVPAFASALLGPRSPTRCLAPAKIRGNKNHWCKVSRDPSLQGAFGPASAPLQPPQRSCPSEKLDDKEQGTVFLKSAVDFVKATTTPVPCRWNTDPHNQLQPCPDRTMHLSEHPTEASRDNLQPPWVTGEPNPCVTAARLGASCTPPQRDPLVSPLGGGCRAVCSTTAQHPQGSGTLWWPPNAASANEASPGVCFSA